MREVGFFCGVKTRGFAKVVRLAKFTKLLMGDELRKTDEEEVKNKDSHASWGSRAFASGRTWVKTNGKYAPAASFLIGLITLLGIYAAAQSSKHVPPGIWWPVISLLGIHLPERAIYLLGFTGTAAGIVGAHSQKYYVT